MRKENGPESVRLPRAGVQGGDLTKDYRQDHSRKPQARATFPKWCSRTVPVSVSYATYAAETSQTKRNPYCGREPGRVELWRKDRPGAAPRKVLTDCDGQTASAPLPARGACASLVLWAPA